MKDGVLSSHEKCADNLECCLWWEYMGKNTIINRIILQNPLNTQIILTLSSLFFPAVDLLIKYFSNGQFFRFSFSPHTHTHITFSKAQ